MKTKARLGCFVLTIWCLTGRAQTQTAGPALRLEQRTNSFGLTVSSLPETGALFIYQATNLQTLAESPSLLLQTNTPSTNDFLYQWATFGSQPGQGYFSAALWPGLSTDDFGDPEDYPDEPPPDTVLVTAGQPDPLVSEQEFTVDFFVIDPSGQLLDVNQTVSVRVLRESDGALHPNAQVSPPTGQLVGGHLQLKITITASTSLQGYTLGLGPEVMQLTLTSFLKTAFNVSTNISAATSNALYQALEDLRTASADTNLAWGYPLSGTNYPVAGTFGEWRGDNNKRIHEGLDLVAPGNTKVLASRGGVVSRKGAVSSCMGDYLVIDHGDGWFSRYLHLATNAIVVKVGQSVTNGQTLATNLLTGGCIGTHLHFELRRTATTNSQWNVGSPGSSHDPLQIADFYVGSSIFAVPPGTNPPVMAEIGLTGKNPATNAFTKANPSGSGDGPVYVFAKFLDLEGPYRLSLRALGFLPEGISTNNWIWISNETAIATYLPTTNGVNPSTARLQGRGFARYTLHTVVQNGITKYVAVNTDYFRYWWKWDTSIYSNATGPRSIVLTGVDYGGATSNYTFTFGPQIKGGEIALVSPLQYRFTNVAYLGTSGGPQLVQPDQYRMQILQTNGMPLPGVTWSPSLLTGDYTPVINTHTNEQVYSFTLPTGTITDGLKLRVSSKLTKYISHEAPIAKNPQSWTRLDLPPANDFLHALAGSGGDLYAGGSFTMIGGVAANRIAKWNGASWSALGSGLSREVTFLAGSGGEMYVGGIFTNAGGISATNLAKWNGSSWSALGYTPIIFGLSALAVSGSDLYAANSGFPLRLGKWDGTDWSMLDWGLGALAYALAVSGNDVYVGGPFTTAGGGPGNYIAKWNGSWTDLGSGMNGTVFALAVSGSDLYAGGSFTNSGGVSANRIAKWNGASWSALGLGMNSGRDNGEVRALAVSGGDVYVGGAFTTAGGVPARNVAKWNGTDWSALGSGVPASVEMVVVSGGVVYVGGQNLGVYVWR